jgi:NADPH:quinone reductase-like Zn-dependent oxidoreductase
MEQKFKRNFVILNESGKPELKTEQTQSLKEKQVLIKVMYAPVSTYDKSSFEFKKTQFGKTEKREALGSEGSGIIEDVGPGVDQSLKGKKVAFCHGGWAEYTVAEVDKILIFNDNVDLRLASSAVINPLTALCVKYILLDKGAKSFVFHGANSNLGRMFIKVAQHKNLQPIALVQTEAEMNSMKKELGLNNVLWHDNSEAFWTRFSSLVADLQPRFLIDVCGSDWSGLLFERMPAYSVMILLGDLANKKLSINATEFFMHNKLIRGFNLEHYFREELTEDRRKQFYQIIQEDINEGGEYFGNKNIAREFKLDEWKTAIDQVEQLQDKGRIVLDIGGKEYSK